MTSREARTLRRAAERKAAKQAAKAAKVAPISAPSGFVLQTTIEPSKRAEINRQNAQHSTGPSTPQGKLASSRNSFKHGLASGAVIIPGEDPAAFEALQRDLLEEHKPANLTEELLVIEMAQSYWLSQRAIRLQNECFTQNGLDERRLALFLRYQTTHERAFHKALSTLLSLRRGEARLARFVSQNSPNRTAHGVRAGTAPGFVPETEPQSAATAASNTQFVSQNRSEPLAQAA